MEIENKEDVKYKGATCRGSYSLGTACGKCEKCEDEIAKRVTPYLKWCEEQDRPIPVERITREEAYSQYAWYSNIKAYDKIVIKRLFDYIEFLEVNRK